MASLYRLGALALLGMCLVASTASAQSLSLYADGLCKSKPVSVSVVAGLCYNHSFGDFVITSATSDPSKVWMSLNVYSDGTCTTPITTTADFANQCALDPAAQYNTIMQVSQSVWTSYYYEGCNADCTSCPTQIIAPPNVCTDVAVRGWVKTIPLGLGTGGFSVQFFQSNDGTCRNRLPAVTLVPDSTCYGDRGMQLSSLDAHHKTSLPHRKP